MIVAARRLSSNATFIYKRIFPIFWFGFLATFLVMGISMNSRIDPNIVSFIFLPFLIIPLAMMVLGYFVFKAFIFDLADEVTDDGDSVVVRKGRETVRVALQNIMNVSHASMRPERITLMLRHPSSFGDKITFMPPQRNWPFSMHPVAEDLIRRIDATRH